MSTMSTRSTTTTPTPIMSTTSTQRPPAPLDHDAYPHILDLVVNNAPRASLISLRSVSRHLRFRADALLAGSHLVITAGPPGQTVVSTPQGRFPAFCEWDRGNDLDMVCRYSPQDAVIHKPAALVHDDLGFGGDELDIEEFDLRRIRLVDVVGMAGVPQSVQDLIEFLSDADPDGALTQRKPYTLCFIYLPCMAPRLSATSIKGLRPLAGSAMHRKLSSSSRTLRKCSGGIRIASRKCPHTTAS